VDTPFPEVRSVLAAVSSLVLNEFIRIKGTLTS